MIQIVPAIDLIGGRCVRLTKGDYGRKKVYDASPAEMVRRYAECGAGRIHIVDLDGAKSGRPENLRVLEECASAASVPVEWGGGISSPEALKSVFDAGAAYAIAGSKAVSDPGMVSGWMEGYPGRIILGADVRLSGEEWRVAVKGWTELSAISLDELIDRYLPFGVKEVISTDISVDGCLSGPSVALYRHLLGRFPQIRVVASGGVASMEDVRALDAAGVPAVVVGKAIYEGHITMEELAEWSQNA